MRQALIPHPEFRPEADFRIDVDIAPPRSGLLTLHYIVTGDIAALRLPPVSAPLRTDGLWQSTCFEAFVRASPESTYYEFNFAPSTQWAAYRFDGYRSGMTPVNEIDAQHIDVQSNDAGFELRVALDLARLPDLPFNAPWHLGLSAVIEETNGRKSYWALAHPPGKPDFHHSDCFALEVPTA
jgi:hypothetical protein